MNNFANQKKRPFFKQRKARKGTKKIMEGALTAFMCRSFHDFFSGQFVLFVVKKKEFSLLPAVQTYYTRFWMIVD